MNKKFNKTFNDQLNELFTFTKDDNDILEYHKITKKLNDLEIEYTKNTLSFHLKYNYCSNKLTTGGIYKYTGLKIND